MPGNIGHICVKVPLSLQIHPKLPSSIYGWQWSLVLVAAATIELALLVIATLGLIIAIAVEMLTMEV